MTHLPRAKELNVALVPPTLFLKLNEINKLRQNKNHCAPRTQLTFTPRDADRLTTGGDAMATDASAAYGLGERCSAAQSSASAAYGRAWGGIFGGAGFDGAGFGGHRDGRGAPGCCCCLHFQKEKAVLFDSWLALYVLPLGQSILLNAAASYLARITYLQK